MSQATRMTASEREAYTRGRALFERGDTQAALAELGKLLETRSDFADVHYMVGVLLDASGEVEEVLDDEGLRQDQLALTALEGELAQLSLQFKPGYYKVAELEAQIASLESAIERKRNRIFSYAEYLEIMNQGTELPD